jgi:hypothetical protein
MPRLRGVIRIVAHVALALATLEGIARLDDRLRDGAPILGTHGIDSLFESAGSGRVGVPDRRFGKWALNSLGYRGDEPVAGRDVVLVFGARSSSPCSMRAGPGGTPSSTPRSRACGSVTSTCSSGRSHA